MTTKALNQDEKKNRDLDYISGFEIIDNEFRLFVLEGVSTGGMKKLAEALPRNDPNSERFKILKNPDIKFKERIYTEFNVEIKRVLLYYNLPFLIIIVILYFIRLIYTILIVIIIFRNH